MTAPLEQLAQHVRPRGPAETPCPGPQEPFKDKTLLCAGSKCLVCGGTGTIVSSDVLAVREALLMYGGMQAWPN